MPRYRIEWTVTYTGDFHVEADSPEEADAKWEEMLDSGEIDPPNPCPMLGNIYCDLDHERAEEER